MKKIKKQVRGITLVALVVTIIVLLILAGIAISLSIGNNGIFTRADTAVEENRKQTATEIMNMKITGIQIESYSENKKLPNLQYLADKLCEDDEMDYVIKRTQPTASLPKIDVKDVNSIYTKLKEYPYEFEINDSLQLASVDGIKVGNVDIITKLNIKTNDKILYKNNNFKIVRIIGNAITMVCIPDSNTPTIRLGGWNLSANGEEILNNSCADNFTDESLGIKSEDIYNARKTDYAKGWLETPTDNGAAYWLSSGYLIDTGSLPHIYQYYMQKDVGLAGALVHRWGSGGSSFHRLAICPIITLNANLIKLNNDNQFYIE